MTKPLIQVLFSLMVVATVSIGLYQSFSWPTATALFPRAIGFPVLALSIVTFVLGLFDLWRGKGREALDVSSSFDRNAILNTTRIFGWLVGFAVAIWVFGFDLTVPVFVFSYTKLQGKLSWFTCFLIAAAATAFVFIVFGLLFNVEWPRGAVLEVL